MFGGFGGRNPQMRSIRLLLLVAVLVAGAAFHDSGPTYTTIRIAYYAVIVGFIGFALYRRSVHKHQGTSTTAPPGPAPSPAVPGEPWSPTYPVLNPGWFPDQHDMLVQRYWDGSAWVGTRHWEENRWVDG